MFSSMPATRMSCEQFYEWLQTVEVLRDWGWLDASATSQETPPDRS